MHTSCSDLSSSRLWRPQQAALCELRLQRLRVTQQTAHASASFRRCLSQRGNSRNGDRSPQRIACCAVTSIGRPKIGGLHQQKFCRSATASPDAEAEAFDFPVASSDGHDHVEALEIAKMPEEDRKRLRGQFDQFDKDGCARSSQSLPSSPACVDHHNLYHHPLHGLDNLNFKLSRDFMHVFIITISPIFSGSPIISCTNVLHQTNQVKNTQCSDRFAAHHQMLEFDACSDACTLSA